MRLLLAATFFHFLLLLAALPRRRWRCCRRSLLGLLSLSGSGSRGLCWWVARGSRGTAWAGTAVAGVAACPSRGFLFSCHWSFSGGNGGSCCYVRYYTLLGLKNSPILNECFNNLKERNLEETKDQSIICAKIGNTVDLGNKELFGCPKIVP